MRRFEIARLLMAGGLLNVLIAAPLLAQQPPPQFVPDQYIVVLRDEVANPHATAAQMAQQYGVQIGHVYAAALKGFSAVVPPGRLRGLQNDPRVVYVEQDQVFEAQGKLEALGKPGEGDAGALAVQTVPTGVRRIGGLTSLIARIDGVDGAGHRVPVNVAVLDTGIQPSHADLYVLGGYNATSRKTNNWADGNGHGTHVAGTIAALDNGYGVVGVAPGAGLYAVKVLNDQGSGFTSWIVAGIDWVAANSDKIQVANMSLGGGSTQSMLDALDRAVGKGVVFCVAAGNSSVDCRGSSPANSTSTGVVTVSALADSDGLAGGLGGATGSGNDDWYATFSNNGRNEPFNSDIPYNGVDVIAPGVSIYSTYRGGGYATMSGTSMASPHAAGVAALHAAAYRSTYNVWPSPGDAKLALLKSPPAGSWKSYQWPGTSTSDPVYYYGDGLWRAILGDNDSGGTSTDPAYAPGYEALVNAGAF